MHAVPTSRRTFDGLHVDSSFGDDEVLKGSSAPELLIESLLFKSMGTQQAPTSRIAFIVLLNPRILSTLMRF
jgi:hypothetical protein